MKKYVVCAALSFAFCNTVEASDRLYVTHTVNVSEGGGFFTKTTKEMTTPEFNALSAAGCVALGFTCAGAAQALQYGAQYAQTVNSNGNYTSTGRLTRQEGENWYFVYDAPQGYEICRGSADIGHGSITGESTFNGSIARNANWNGLSNYIEVPKDRSSGQWVSFTMLAEYVPSGTAGQNGCWADETVVWKCKGQSCSNIPGGRM